MKIDKNKHQKLYDLLDHGINQYSYTASLDDLRDHRRDNDGKDKERRFRWDLFWMAKRVNRTEMQAWLDDIYSIDCNDDHIDTVLRQFLDKRPQLAIREVTL